MKIKNNRTCACELNGLAAGDAFMFEGGVFIKVWTDNEESGSRIPAVNLEDGFLTHIPCDEIVEYLNCELEID